MIRHNKRDGIYYVDLPFGFRVGVGKTHWGYIPWHKLERWVYFMKYDDFHAWHFRVAWFFLGRKRK